jgi:hypothetical protein
MPLLSSHPRTPAQTRRLERLCEATRALARQVGLPPPLTLAC